MADKERLDTLLVQRNFFESKERAKAAVMAGLVFVRGERADKPGTKMSADVPLDVKAKLHPYVSRGGLKLEKAVQVFDLQLKNRIVVDIGASTGGFTDCALQYGAQKVVAVDVGYGQLDWTLRNDPRVVVMERTNFRYLRPEDWQYEAPTLATIDVSFISLRIILPVLHALMASDGEVVALVKPQFEAGREKVGKKGVVRDPEVHYEVLEAMCGFCASIGFRPVALDYSPVTGGVGNVEFLLYLQRQPKALSDTEGLREEMETVVRNARRELIGSGRGGEKQ